MWRKNIHVESAKSGQRVYTICLKVSVDLLNSILSLHPQSEIDFTTFWGNIQKNIIKMFVRGIMDTKYTLSFETFFSKTLHSLQQPHFLSWILLRFSQYCGILLTNNCINQIASGHYLKITSVDLLDFKVKIKCLPFLDYYGGLHYLNQARQTQIIRTKITLLKSAEEKLNRIRNYDLPDVRLYHVEALFTCMRLDSSTVGNINEIMLTYEEMLTKTNKGSEQYFEFYLNYLCACFWETLLSKNQEKERDEYFALLTVKNFIFSKFRKKPEGKKEFGTFDLFYFGSIFGINFQKWVMDTLVGNSEIS